MARKKKEAAKPAKGRKTAKKEPQAAAWFKKGDEGLKEKEKIDTVAKMRQEKNTPRFRLKEGEEAIIVFVDDEGFYAKVHQFEMDGNWGNFITCTKDFGPCKVCDTGKRPTYTAHYTIIDTREFTKRDGTKVKNSKILFPAKGSTINMLADLKKKYGSLVGRVFRVKRYSKNDPNCGNYFELASTKRVNLVAKFGKDADKPLDYMSILAPPTEEELKALGFGGTVVGSEEDISDDELEQLLD
jgi:hypothetical protein